MDIRLKVLEDLKSLIEKAKVKDGEVTREEVSKALNMKEINADAWEVIGDFLYTRGVKLEGFVPSKLVKVVTDYEYTPEEKSFVTYYEKELRTLNKKKRKELDEALAVLNEQTKEECYHALMPYIYKTASRFVGHGELLPDLVQEANVSVFMELSEAGGSVSKFERIAEDALNSFLMLDEDRRMENGKIVAKLNQLLEASEQLQDQNALYSIEDISEFLDIEVDEIDALLRIAGEQ